MQIVSVSRAAYELPGKIDMPYYDDEKPGGRPVPWLAIAAGALVLILLVRGCAAVGP